MSHRYMSMDMESPHTMLQPVLGSLRLRFEALLSRPPVLQDPNQDETLTPGQMLLMGFNGLFGKLQMESNTLISALGSLEIPPSWKKINHIKDSREVSAMIFNEDTRKVRIELFINAYTIIMQLAYLLYFLKIFFMTFDIYKIK